MNVTVVGAGNIGTQFAVHCAEKGHRVILYTSKPNKINKKLVVVDINEQVIHKGIIHRATSDVKEAFSEAELIFVTVPAYMMKDIADQSIEHIRNHVWICLVPGSGGGECAFKNHLEKGAVVFGLQRVPSVARLIQYGHSVKAVGYRDVLYVGAMPHVFSTQCADIINSIFDQKCLELPNYLNLTLTPSNQILHTTRLKTIFKNYTKGMSYPKMYMMYEEWDNESSELMLKCDAEVQEICRKLEEKYLFDLSDVISLKEHYESSTKESLTEKLSSIEGFKGIFCPMKKIENGNYIPDFDSRYFLADFLYGLSILVQIAKFLGTSFDNMRDTMAWHKNIFPNEVGFRYSDYGMNNIDEFIEFYSK